MTELRDITGPTIAAGKAAGHAHDAERLLRRSKGLHKLMYNKLRLPLGASEGVIRGLKYLWNMEDARCRRRLAEDLHLESDDWDLEQNGFRRFEPGQLHGVSEAVDACRAAHQVAHDTGALAEARASSRKDYLVSVIRNEGALHHRRVMELALSRTAIDTASKYLGSVPILSAVRLWWTPPNSSTTESQMYHSDREDRKQLKFLIFVTDCNEKTGPFTIIPANMSERIKTTIGYSYRHHRRPDSEIRAAGAGEDAISLTGRSGTVACVDTSRCLHFGARQNTAQRLMLVLQYTSSLAPNVTVPRWLPDHDHPHYEFDDLQRLVLGLAAV